MNPRRSPSTPSVQLLPSEQEVSEILQQMSAEISQMKTADMVEVANSAASQSKLQELLPVYFYSQLQSPEAVIIHLLLKQWRDSSERRRERRAFEVNNERLRGRVAELERKLYESRNEVHRVAANVEESEPEVNRLTTRVQDLPLQYETESKSTHNKVCVYVHLFQHVRVY